MSIFNDRFDDVLGRRNGMQSPFAAIDDQFRNDPFFRSVMSMRQKPESEDDCHEPTEETKTGHDDENCNFQVYSYESISETRDGNTTCRTQRRYRDNTGRDFVKEAKLLNGMELQHEKKMVGEKVLHEARSLVNKTGEPEATMENIDAFDKEWEKQTGGEERNALADRSNWAKEVFWPGPNNEFVLAAATTTPRGDAYFFLHAFFCERITK